MYLFTFTPTNYSAAVRIIKYVESKQNAKIFDRIICEIVIMKSCFWCDYVNVLISTYSANNLPGADNSGYWWLELIRAETCNHHNIVTTSPHQLGTVLTALLMIICLE